MFEGLLKSKFYSKCKSSIKLTNTRLEIIRRKRNAMQKYLKNDIADLLKNGLDINAYGRAEGLLVELNLSRCYDFVEQFCGCVSNHLPVMNKQRECPEECKEAVSSLMFAAARFADLPELREFRSIFTDRYGNSLESYVNQEFVKLNSTSLTKDMKLQLMQDIALESGVEWDCKALEQKLYKPPASKQDRSKDANDDIFKSHQMRNEFIQKTENHDAGYENNKVEYTATKMDMEVLSSQGRKEVNNDVHKLHNRGEIAASKGYNQGHLSPERLEKTPNKDIEVASTDQNAPGKVENKMPFYHRLIPPPYIKQKDSKNEISLEVPPAGSGGEGAGQTKLNGHIVGEDNNSSQDNSAREAKPKPRSVRRRGLKPPPGHNDTGSDASNGVMKMNSNGMKEEDAKQLHNEQGKVEETLKPPPLRQVVDTSNAMMEKSNDGHPARATSFPLEPTSPTEATKGHARASSFQPDMSNANSHVHPKLPDYDDFMARFAALKGK
ncbi:hypothetical protein F0562_022963 [Nyssa sinensis]|uniref:IST1-like protein n=1 Tax=Nyssa sinensis TaxID=561372 RepID=A0A5J5BKX8_9ASTE|nr:hypothetical protein F0562_022963 [Nyssa sinensis]